ncbi:head GIN domain-containing protein [Marinifilum fragile]|uniref:head GIN domain-containing protein n=1 Tax=Marinifilum fragile TaxID=570161 RepID=UPI002AA86142|nr:head GIN domain-containing protein [Marinifilum fragile]
MKKLLKKMSLTLIALTMVFSSTVNAQFWGEKGNGNVKKQDREIGSFSAISSSSGIDVYLRQGDKESVTVEADENLLDLIVTRIKGDELIIKTEDPIRRAKKLNVYVTFVKVNEISVSSGSDLESSHLLKFENLDISVSSGADAKLELQAEDLTCSVSSGADANLSGTANSFYGKASSGSDLRAADLKAKICKAKASSGGDVSVYAIESIEASASSGGDVNYYGNPTKVNVSNSSGGDVNRR